MKCLEFPLLADENVHPGVVASLRARGLDVVSTAESLPRGSEDVVVMRRALEAGRVVLTHDSDFGALAVRLGEPLVGIVYLRPGHIRPSFVLEMIDALATVQVAAPFIVVVERASAEVRIRYRQLPVTG